VTSGEGLDRRNPHLLVLLDPTSVPTLPSSSLCLLCYSTAERGMRLSLPIYLFAFCPLCKGGEDLLTRVAPLLEIGSGFVDGR